MEGGFAGNGPIERVKALAQSLGVESLCQFLGWMNGKQKDGAFRRAPMLCLASCQEGFPMAVLDAWAYGVPVVSTPAGGLIDIIKEGNNGLLFEAGNIDQMAEELEKMIVDADMRKHIGEESRMLAYTTFNINTINHQLGNIYEELSR